MRSVWLSASHWRGIFFHYASNLQLIQSKAVDTLCASIEMGVQVILILIFSFVEKPWSLGLWTTHISINCKKGIMLECDKIISAQLLGAHPGFERLFNYLKIARKAFLTSTCGGWDEGGVGQKAVLQCIPVISTLWVNHTSCAKCATLILKDSLRYLAEIRLEGW